MGGVAIADRRGGRRLWVLMATLAMATCAAAAPTPAMAVGYHVQTLTFKVVVGPNNDQPCTIVGDLYKPDTASANNPAPAILTTNGFGGAKDDSNQKPLAMLLASHGYVVLSYSGLGFGSSAGSPNGSGCKITLDDPDYDGKAASQLVTFLGGGTTATDGTNNPDGTPHQVSVGYVKHDAVAHDGKAHSYDPRVGLIGGSYGGEFQFAVAGIDPRVDTIVPIITWNDLSYSLAPNNTSFLNGVTYNTPGVEKAQWTSLFFGVGIADGVFGAAVDPTRNVGCPNFDNRACTAKAQLDATGAPDDTTLALARHASVTSYIQNIRIPTLLAQGQADTLFNLQESVATYRALRAKGVPTKLIWQSWGHSSSKPAPGELDPAQPATSYEARTFLQWFDHYLADVPAAPALDFTYFRDYIGYSGDATAAYARADAYPAGSTQQLFLSGSSALVSSQAAATPGVASFLTPAAGAPTSYTETSALDQSQPVTDAPGTFAKFTGPPLSADEDVIGVPTADVSISAPTFPSSQSVGDAPKELTLFFKLYDVKPDGTIVLTHRLISPVRVADFSHPLHVELPGIVHRFAAGDRIALTIAAGDFAYRGTNVVGPVTVVVDAAHPGVVTLPVVAAAQQLPIAVTPLLPSIGAAAATNTAGSAGCRVGGSLSLSVPQSRGSRVTAAALFVNGRLVRRISGRRVTSVTLAHVPRGTYTVRIVSTSARRTRQVSVSRYRGCQKLRSAQRRVVRQRRATTGAPFAG